MIATTLHACPFCHSQGLALRTSFCEQTTPQGQLIADSIFILISFMLFILGIIYIKNNL